MESSRFNRQIIEMTVALVSLVLLGLDFLRGVTETKRPSINVIEDEHVCFTSVKEWDLVGFFISKNTGF